MDEIDLKQYNMFFITVFHANENILYISTVNKESTDKYKRSYCPEKTKKSDSCYVLFVVNMLG